MPSHWRSSNSDIFVQCSFYTFFSLFLETRVDSMIEWIVALEWRHGRCSEWRELAVRRRPRAETELISCQCISKDQGRRLLRITGNVDEKYKAGEVWDGRADIISDRSPCVCVPSLARLATNLASWLILDQQQLTIANLASQLVRQPTIVKFR